MSYQVIARKWRPQRFDDVIGQRREARFDQRNAKRGFAGPRMADQPDPLGQERHALRLDRRRAGAGHAARLTAADIDDQFRQDRQPVIKKRRIHPALEAASRVAGQGQRLAGQGDPLGREVSNFEQGVGGRSGHP